MMHVRIVQHLKIDLIGVEKTEKGPEAKDDQPHRPIDFAADWVGGFRGSCDLDFASHELVMVRCGRMIVAQQFTAGRRAKETLVV